jgi:hypothetical protein
MIREFNEQHIYRHIYQLKEERAYRTVIRYLHHSTNLDDIKQEVAELGNTVRNTINVRYKQTKEPLNHFFVVDLEPAQNNKKIYEVTGLQNRTVKIQPPHSSETNITQCMRCQQYGRIKSYCNKPFFCVNCSGPHNTTECKTNNNKKYVIHQQDVPYAEATIQQTIRDVNITVN